MEISDIKYQDGWLMLRTDDRNAAIRLKYGFRSGNYDLVRHKEKRSRNANNYAWSLMNKLAEKTGIPVNDIYNQQLEDAGAKSDMVWCKTEAVYHFIDAFIGDHIGRRARVIEKDDQDTCLLLQYGSSDFNTQEMSKLLENIIQDCKACGIETEDENYINDLLSRWQYG